MSTGSPPTGPTATALWRVRATLPDRPGSLAALAQECAAAGANIEGVQVFPGNDDVTDELLLRTAPGRTPSDLAVAVERAGGRDVVAVPCAEAALVDQPHRYVEACREVLAEPASFPDVVARLFDADTGGAGEGDVLGMSVDDVLVQVRRAAPFTDVERARGAAMAGLVSDVLARQRPTFAATGTSRLGTGATPQYVVEGAQVAAVVDGVAVGRATLTVRPGEAAPVAGASGGDAGADVRDLGLRVDPAWQRRGIGTKLLGEATRLARRLGADEVVLTAAHDNRAVMPMVLAAGLRGRIRMQGDTLTVRISVAPPTSVSGQPAERALSPAGDRGSSPR